jgi:hypothetical protein
MVIYCRIAYDKCIWTILVVQSSIFFFRNWDLVYKLFWRSMQIDCFTRMVECSFMFPHTHRIHRLHKKVTVRIFAPLDRYTSMNVKCCQIKINKRHLALFCYVGKGSPSFSVFFRVDIHNFVSIVGVADTGNNLYLSYNTLATLLQGTWI